MALFDAAYHVDHWNGVDQRVYWHQSTPQKLPDVPARWYKDEVLGELATNLENSPVFTAIELSTNSHFQVSFTLERLQHSR